MQNTVAPENEVAVVACPYCDEKVIPNAEAACPVCHTDLRLLVCLDEVGKSYYLDGVEALEAGRHQDAVRCLTTALETNPRDSRYALATARALGITGDVEQARRLVRAVLDREKDNSDAPELLRELDKSAAKQLRSQQVKRLRVAAVSFGFACLGATVMLAGLLVNSVLKPSPESVVANALSRSRHAKLVKVQGSGQGSNVRLSGSVPSSASRAEVIALAASTGEKIDSGGLRVEVADPVARVMNALTELDGRLVRGLRWSEVDGVVRGHGVMRCREDAEVLRHRLADVAKVGPVDLSSVTFRGQLIRVRRGDALWNISERVYGHGDYYTKLRTASGQPIRDLRGLRSGQVLFAPYASWH